MQCIHGQGRVVCRVVACPPASRVLPRFSRGSNRSIDVTTAFGVPAASLGHLYQLRYALLLLLRAVRDIGPTVELSLERTDDITLDDQGEPSVVVQTKNRDSIDVVRPASLTDASVDLWKTIRVWTEGIASGAIRIPGTLLHLVSTATASPGSAAAMLRPSERDVEQALQQLRAVASTSRSRENALAYAAFNRLADSEQRSMLEQVRILDRSPNIGDVRSLLSRELVTSVTDQRIPAFLDRLEGWWLNRAIAHLRAPEDDRISGLDLIHYMQELQRQFRDDALPIDDDLVDAAAPEVEDHERLMFVRQLRLIGLRHSGVLSAIQDYYRAFAQRSRWARDDLLYVNELARYERRLIDEWQHAFSLMEAACPEDEPGRAAAGLTLYSSLSQRYLPIRPECTDGFISRGSLHILADGLRIGWHADFLDRLRELLPVPGGKV